MPIWIPLLVAAPFVGSFLGVVILRDADFASIARGRSHCEHCGAELKIRDLVPIVSWLALRARCRTCGARLSFFCPAVEVAAVIIVAWAMTVQRDWLLVLSAFFGWILIVLSWIDMRTLRLPDSLTLPLLLLGLAAAPFLDSENWIGHFIGAGASFVIFAALTFLYRRIRGVEGLGLGDAKLAAALGAFVSWQGMPGTVLMAAVLALLFVLSRALIGNPIARAEPIPLGPFLCSGAWITWLYGPLIPGWN
jgi:leader peptidase (prepilin peptidase)/N-methyltransferase